MARLGQAVTSPSWRPTLGEPVADAPDAARIALLEARCARLEHFAQRVGEAMRALKAGK